MESKENNYIFWIPRILAIAFILFLSLFSLDVLDTDISLIEKIARMFIHNTPSLFLLLIMIISWKKEIIGATFFILSGLAYASLILSKGLDYDSINIIFVISGPAILVGISYSLLWGYRIKH
jgi:hypothetical protein